jgi:hypothetical protein
VKTHFSSDRFDEPILQALVVQASVEVAVVADGAAERDVDVQARD